MLEQTWRWFGTSDRITLNMIRQTGASGIVSALYEIPTGEIWPEKDILEYKKQIEEAGFTWQVVESLPIHEDIKRKSGDYLKYIDHYKTSVRNLGKAGITTICYNFMPVLDWARTNLKNQYRDNSVASLFNSTMYAAIDLFILKREDAEKSYPKEVVNKAKSIFASLSDKEIENLTSTFLLGIPGTGETFTLDELKTRIAGYKNIDKDTLKSHLFFFLKEIIPVAEQCGVRMAIHPDDPPWSLLGLPRIVGTLKDLREITEAIDSLSNGITLCTGSLGSGYFNDVPEIAKTLSSKINFAHLRNVSRDEDLNFKEEYFFEGDVDMYSVVKQLVLEQEKRKKEGRSDWKIPFRPDHGNQIFDDVNQNDYPGYSLYGRMKNLAEIRGLETGIRRSLGLT